MKTLKPILAALVLAVMVTEPAMASGARGGGDIIDVIVDGKPQKELYDLVSSYVCDWQSGRKMMEENPEYLQVLEKIAVLDWYMAFEIRRETASLDFCMTNSLLPIFKFLKTSPDKTMRAAFRFGGDVYWDQDDAAKLSPRSRAFLLLHEVLHSYLSMEWPQALRYLKLRSAVKTFSRVEEGTVSSRAELYFQLRKNSIGLPMSADRLDPYRRQLEFILADLEDQAALVVAAASPEELIDLDKNNQNILSALSPWDAYALQNADLKEILSAALQNAISRADLAGFQALLSKPYVKINSVFVALSVENALSEEKLGHLYNSEVLLPAFDRLYQSLVEMKIVSGRTAARRIWVTPEFLKVIITPENPGDVSPNLVDATPFSVKNSLADLPVEVQGLVRVTANWANHGKWDLLHKTILNNHQFYDAFGLKAQAAMVRELNPAVVREKALALSVLGEVKSGLVALLLDQVKKGIKEDDAKSEFESRVQYQRFEEAVSASFGGRP